MDGDTDLVARANGALLVFANDGSGELEAGDPIALPSADALAAGDLDGDGLPDIVAEHSVLWNDGGDGFLEPESLGVPGAGDVRDLAVADLDRDGNLDLVVAGSRQIAVLRGRGELRAFDQTDNLVLPDVEAVTFSDIDGDGFPDLLAASFPTDPLSVFRNAGDGRFHEPIVFPAGPGGAWLAAEDFDGDGANDVAARAFDGFRVLFNQRLEPAAADCDSDGIPDGCRIAGNDCNANDRLDGCDLRPRLATAVMQNTAVGPRPLAFAVADLDGDGDGDTAVIDRESRTVSILVHVGNGELTKREEIETRRDPGAITAGDLDGDGDVDLAVGEGDIVFLRNLANEGFARSGIVARGRGFLRAADMDSDVDLDLLFLSRRNEIGYLRNDGNGVFVEVLIDGRFGEGRSVALADLDGDSDLDLARVARGRGEVSVLRGDGEGGFGGEEVFNISPLGGLLITASDLDGNGVAELLVTDGFGEGPPSVTLFHELADGELRRRETLDLASDANWIDAGDINGDGIADIVLGLDGRIVPFFGRGNGSLRRLPPLGVRSGSLETLEIADVDGDEVPDLAVLTSASLSGAVTALLNRTPPPEARDCDGNLRIDRCQITEGTALDANDDGIPDRCQGSRQVPGDCNQDGDVNMTDALCMFSVLFLGDPEGFPCGSGTARDPAVAALLDWQGDGVVDIADAVAVLSHLFFGGAPHPLMENLEDGRTCLPLPGCPDLNGCLEPR